MISNHLVVRFRNPVDGGSWLRSKEFDPLPKRRIVGYPKHWLRHTWPRFDRRSARSAFTETFHLHFIRTPSISPSRQGQSPLNSASKSEASDLEHNKAFKEAEGLNIIDSVSNPNQEESNHTAVNMEPKPNTAQAIECLYAGQVLPVNTQSEVKMEEVKAKGLPG